MIKQLKINQLRNLSDINLSLGEVVLLIGQNGSGKTSLLESVFLLSRGKSFRHFESKRYISHAADSCTVWASVQSPMNDHPTLVEGELLEEFAIAKFKDPAIPSKLRHNHAPLPSQATLTRRLPTLLIDPSGMSILENGTADRRQLLDFLCFHCKPEFHNIWLDHQRSLKHRNALLKSAQNVPPNSYAFEQICVQIGAWDYQLANFSNKINELRQLVFDSWQSEFQKILHQLLPDYADHITLSYQAGFDDKLPLIELLSERLMSDIELGYTRVGCHRADLGLHIKLPLDNGKYHKELAVNVLSRGEKKLLITALKLSGLPILCHHQSFMPIILIDDIDSELDDNASTLLLQNLAELPCQVFVSSLNMAMVDKINRIFNKKVTALAIKNGTIKPIKSSNQPT